MYHTGALLHVPKPLCFSKSDTGTLLQASKPLCSTSLILAFISLPFSQFDTVSIRVSHFRYDRPHCLTTVCLVHLATSSSNVTLWLHWLAILNSIRHVMSRMLTGTVLNCDHFPLSSFRKVL